MLLTAPRFTYDGLMPTDVVMPQMGESIAEGTIVRWIKKVGDSVERDEPLFEISTDKVDAEIPSPVAGVIAEIRAQEGETVPVNSVVAVIGSGATKPAAAPPPPAAPLPEPRPQADGATTTEPAAPAPSAPPSSAPPPVPPVQPTPPAASTPASAAVKSGGEGATERSSPLVRRIAKEHNIDIAQVRGTGIGGRVTKDDIMAFIAGSAGSGTATRPTEAPRPQAPAAAAAGGPRPGTSAPMSPMRKKIAEHMILSRRTSAHVHSVFEVNFSRVAQIREAKKAEYERAGAKLTYLSFILKAAAAALRAVPVVNASVEGDAIVYHQDVNIGIAVALDWGLIVPVVRGADNRSLADVSRAVSDLAGRARSKQLKPDEVTGGTFTITNPGVFGALFGMPIINQPQVAILGIGNVEKRAIVIDDAIAIRPMAYLSIGYDHRIIDGAVADEFMSQIKRSLESWDPTQA
jgi:2-oxoglutarate dehydrogenase E2 component (dihydrolipoamide succinyltransferase)